MKMSKTIAAAALLGASSFAVATPEVRIDYAMDDAASMVQTIGDGTYQGYFIWANTTFDELYVAWADHDGDGADHYFNRLQIDNGVDTVVDLTIDASDPQVLTSLSGSTTIEVLENTGNFVDAYKVEFDPSISLSQDLIFWLASEDASMNECIDFGFGVGETCEGEVVDSVAINVWNNGTSSWFNTFETELLEQSLNWPGTNNAVLAQKFELTRVSEPASIAMFGLGLAGLMLARRKRA